ncbi:hypothetical protein OUZ56_003405 [Daphnia magna]|uniref:SWIM-type domain-containing protein n=1 Tax=Daphnia magna TaxID=35525 RepID=A0ABR0A917_9CRUS|nr:hypothetical protein OUZ56_003405 [Daphnia magna]
MDNKIIEEERISLDPKMQIWTGPTCSCVATTTCCHIMAGILFINCVLQLKKQPNRPSADA